jgi:hypothetical protein
MYVDSFIYFLEDPAVKALFCCLLAERCKVGLMGIVEWFLCVHYLWCITPSLVAVYLEDSKSVPIWYHVPIRYHYKFEGKILKVSPFGPPYYTLVTLQIDATNKT